MRYSHYHFLQLYYYHSSWWFSYIQSWWFSIYFHIFQYSCSSLTSTLAVTLISTLLKSHTALNCIPFTISSWNFILFYHHPLLHVSPFPLVPDFQYFFYPLETTNLIFFTVYCPHYILTPFLTHLRFCSPSSQSHLNHFAHCD